MISGKAHEARRLFVIHNPVAGRRRQGFYRAVLGRLVAMGCHVTERSTGGPGDAEQYARELDADGFDAIVVAGGDGTINEVINGMISRPDNGTALALAFIPLGTANVAALEINLLLSVEHVAATIAGGTARMVSLGKIGDRVFLLMVGAGFDAHVVGEVTPVRKRILGKLAYVLASVSLLFRFRGNMYRVTTCGASGDTDSCVASVVLCNGRHYAGPYIIAPEANLERPDLEVCLFEKPGSWHIARYGIAMLLGCLPKAGGYRVIRANKIFIAWAGDKDGDEGGGEPVQVDGDTLENLPVSIEMASTRINLICPEIHSGRQPL